jgi:PAS domain S-box-containing protein/putative nucleotidyltransferase with HDIG domain
MGFTMKKTSPEKISTTGRSSKLRPGAKAATKPKIQRVEHKTTPAQALKDSELRYRRLFESAQDGILILDAQTGMIDDVNPYLIEMLGYTRTEFLKKKLWEVGAFKDVEASKLAFKALQDNEYIRYENLPLRAKGGKIVRVEFVSNVYSVDEGKVIQCNIRDITDRKQREDVLEANEVRYRRLFDDSPVALWEEDYSAVMQRLDALREGGITNFQEYFSSHPETVAECAALVKIVNVNKATMNLFGSTQKEDMLKSLAELFNGEQIKEYEHELINIAEGNTRFGWEVTNKTLDGRPINIDMGWSVIAFGYENTLSRVIVSMIDVTEHKQAQKQILHKNRLYATLAQINETIVHIRDRDALFSEICRVAIKHGKYQMAWIGLVDESNGQVKPTTFAGEENGYLNEISIVINDTKLSSGPTGTAILIGQCVICQDIASDPRMVPWREQAMQRGYRSSAAVPIRQKNSVVGALTVYASDPNSFSDDDQNLLDEIGQDISYALDSIEAETAKNQAKLLLEQQAALLELAHDAILIRSLESEVVFWNRGAEQTYGWTEAEALNHMTQILLHTIYPESLEALDKALLAEGQWEGELIHTRRDGTQIVVASHQVLQRDEIGQPLRILEINRDITDSKKSEEVLLESEARYRGLFEDSPISLWEEDFSAVKGRLDALREEGITDFREYFTRYPEVAAEMAGSIKVVDVNHATLKLFGADQKEEIINKKAHLFYFDQGHEFQKELINIAEGKTSFGSEGSNRTLDGRLIHIGLRWSAAPGFEESLSRVIVSMIDITRRRQSEERVRYQAGLLENVNDAIVATDGQYRITLWNAAAEALYGWKAEEVLGRIGFEITRPEWPGVDSESMVKKIAELGSWRGEATQARKDGTRFPAELSSLVFHDKTENITGYVSLNHDITERKQAELALARSEQAYRTLFENMPIGLYRTAADGLILDANEAMAKMFGYPDREALMAMNIMDLYLDPAADRKFKSEIEKTGIISGFEAEFKRPDETIFWTEDHVRIIRDEDGNLLFYEGSLIDTTERKQAEEKIRLQLEHLAALREIDRVIASSFNLRYNLAWILESVTKELGVDAADVLILNPGSSQLEFGGSTGFRIKAAEKAFERQNQSHALRAVLDRQLVHIPNLKGKPHDLLITKSIADEDFVCYYGVPLIAKGIVKGVLEVYHRTSLEPDQNWLDFLNTLAGQAALAIDNASLFNNLQRSNMDLSLAYDATIEGWSRAMDLRDKETEGHTQRVTEMTMELAGLFGIKDEDLVNVRRGALLHDIGKMGVPDGILLKPDKLTDEEWLIMKKHPSLAYEMLSPIRYLQSAMDIPYCHHEKWDGTGYPRGLKGEQIPLPARIFSIVDVWDALTSDRPYRKAWPNEKVIEYLRSESGSSFDPAVLKTCLESGVFDR